MTDDDYRLDDAEARTLRATLVAELAAAGAFPDPRWRQVFKTVPRHVFVPHVFVPADTAGTYRPLDGTDPARRGEWLRHVYADDIAITQLDGDEKAWKAAMRDGTVTAEAMTCTSSQPALMAGMLAELGVADGARVLEVGTGTGYNAALLAERLGSDLVTTVDVDPGLAEGSRAALAGLGYTPHVVAGDGAAGVEGRAPFDRIVATASFPTIPAAWVEQSAENGVILANLARPLGGVAALVRLVVHGAVAEGRFCARPAGYMPTRTDRTPSALSLYQRVTEAEEDAAPVEGSALDLSGMLAEPGFRFFLGLCSDVEELGVRYPDHPAEQWLVTPDGAWAFATADGEVRQSGPRRLYDEVAGLYGEWRGYGRPDRTVFGLTVTPDGEHRVWLGTPGDGPAWPLVFHSM